MEKQIIMQLINMVVIIRTWKIIQDIRQVMMFIKFVKDNILEKQ